MREGLARIVAGFGSIAAGVALWLALMTPGVVPTQWHDPVLIVALVGIGGGVVLLLVELTALLRRVYWRSRHSPAAIRRRYVALWKEAEDLLLLDWLTPTVEMEKRRSRLFSRTEREIANEDPGIYQQGLVYRLRDPDMKTKIGGVRDTLDQVIRKER
jgi:hypothetical protein